jgi:hypothetical protein
MYLINARIDAIAIIAYPKKFPKSFNDSAFKIEIPIRITTKLLRKIFAVNHQ